MASVMNSWRFKKLTAIATPLKDIGCFCPASMSLKRGLKKANYPALIFRPSSNRSKKSNLFALRSKNHRRLITMPLPSPTRNIIGNQEQYKTAHLKVVPRVGIEPTLLSEPDFESGASTNFTTEALSLIIHCHP